MSISDQWRVSSTRLPSRALKCQSGGNPSCTHRLKKNGPSPDKIRSACSQTLLSAGGAGSVLSEKKNLPLIASFVFFRSPPDLRSTELEGSNFHALSGSRFLPL